MVLTRRLGVLGFVLGFLLLAACSESLFGARHAGSVDGGGSDSGDVPSKCPEGCIADAAADFDGSGGGKGGHWGYLEDHRNRMWTVMSGAADATAMIGAVPGNQITTCAAHSGEPACKALPGALLVSSAGAMTGADPAIEFIAPEAQPIQLTLHAFMPSGAPQMIRLYRNSREDVLFTGTATAGTPLARAITLDALKGDRFLVAVAPTGNGATNVGLQLFVNTTGTKFPSTCQLAVPFETASGSVTKDLCNAVTFTQYRFPYPTTQTAAVLDMGPFTEQGKAADISLHNYIEADPSFALDWSHDLTLQFWVKLRSKPTSLGERLFADLDAEFGGGVEIWIDPSTGPQGNKLVVKACTDSTNAPTTSPMFDQTSTGYPDDGNWHFVRVVRAGGNVDVCLDGKHTTSLIVKPAPSDFKTSNQPELGKDAVPASSTASDAYFDGWIDDVRALTGALPCD